jgi:hypothetical protein
MRKSLWSEEKIRSGFEEFKRTHGRYPTSHEIDDHPGLPSRKLIERKFGGLVKFRERLGIAKNADFTTGIHSSERAERVIKITRSSKDRAYEYLCDQFGRDKVHREYAPVDDRRSRFDFLVQTDARDLFIDVLSPKDRRSLVGCLNKKRKALSAFNAGEKIVLVVMTKDITDEEIKKTVDGIKKGFRSFEIYSFENFKLCFK